MILQGLQPWAIQKIHSRLRFRRKGPKISLQARGSHQLAPTVGAGGGGGWLEAAAAQEHPFLRAARPESSSPFAETPPRRQRLLPVQHRGLQAPTAGGGGGGRRG